MRHRGKFAQKDRQTRSQLAKLPSTKRLLCGSLVTMARTCGNPRCKCVRKGQKHISLYLSIRDGEKRRMIGITKKSENTSTLGGEHYKIANERMDDIDEHARTRGMEDKDGYGQTL